MFIYLSFTFFIFLYLYKKVSSDAPYNALVYFCVIIPSFVYALLNTDGVLFSLLLFFLVGLPIIYQNNQFNAPSDSALMKTLIISLALTIFGYSLLGSVQSVIGLYGAIEVFFMLGVVYYFLEKGYSRAHQNYIIPNIIAGSCLLLSFFIMYSYTGVTTLDVLNQYTDLCGSDFGGLSSNILYNLTIGLIYFAFACKLYIAPVHRLVADWYQNLSIGSIFFFSTVFLLPYLCSFLVLLGHSAHSLVYLVIYVMCSYTILNSFYQSTREVLMKGQLANLTIFTNNILVLIFLNSPREMEGTVVQLGLMFIIAYLFTTLPFYYLILVHKTVTIRDFRDLLQNSNSPRFLFIILVLLQLSGYPTTLLFLSKIGYLQVLKFNIESGFTFWMYLFSLFYIGIVALVICLLIRDSHPRNLKNTMFATHIDYDSRAVDTMIYPTISVVLGLGLFVMLMLS